MSGMTAGDGIDRLAPTARPPGRAAMKQRWSRLLFLHWPIPPEELRPLLPRGLALDTYAGQAWVGLVPFVVTGARPAFLPSMPGVSSFVEVNVRTYVHHGGRDPGVWFFSLDASSRVAVHVARTLYHLPYRFASRGRGTGPTRARPARPLRLACGRRGLRPQGARL